VKILITICARGGSKGIPRKNVKLLNGVPLIKYSLDIAQKFSLANSVVKVALSTDNIEIKNVAEECGLKTNYLRPHYLAGDETGKIDTLKHLLEYEEELLGERFDFVLDLDVTSPLRTLKDLHEAFSSIQNENETLSLFSVSKAHRNPYFNMVEKKSNGYFSLVKIPPEDTVLSRQNAPEVYDMNASFYWYRRSFFDKNLTTVVTERSIVYNMPHICFDLDSPLDFMFMEYLLVNDKLDFAF